MSSAVTQEVTVPAFRKQAVEISSVLNSGHGLPPPAPMRLRAYRWAKTQLGKPYVWGGTGPASYDCSGLVMVSYDHAGVSLPRTTYDMLASDLLRPETHGQARKGDLAFFGSGHVEIVAGKWMTYGAQEPGTNVGWHRWTYAGWSPTMFFRVVKG